MMMQSLFLFVNKAAASFQALFQVGQFSADYKWYYIKNQLASILTIGGPPLVVCTTFIAIRLLLCLLDDDVISLRLCQQSRLLLSRSRLGYFASDFRQHASLSSTPQCLEDM